MVFQASRINLSKVIGEWWKYGDPISATFICH